MNRQSTGSFDFVAANRKPLLLYVSLILAAAALLSTLLILQERAELALLPLAGIAACLVVANPRWALYQFVFVIFIQFRFTEAVPFFLTDLSALAVILAAAIDFFSGDRLPARMPRLTVNFLILWLAVAAAALFSVHPEAAIHPLARIGLLATTFVSIHRLAAKVELGRLLKFFFWVCVGHSLVTLTSFVAAGGAIRAFGFSPKTLSTLAMAAFPIGIAFFLWERRGRSAVYLVGSAIVLGAIVSTQSRFPLLFALAMAGAMILASWRRSRRLARSNGSQRLESGIRRRFFTLAASALVLGVAVAALRPEMLQAVGERFERLLTASPSGTFRLRLTLWETAWRAFLVNPITGIGPGCFREVNSILTGLHLKSTFWWVRGLSAHNLALHYLAETGLIGFTALIALMINQFRLSRRIWRKATEPRRMASALALYTMGATFLITTLLEAAWMWGQAGMVFVLFTALIARRSQTDGAPPR